MIMRKRLARQDAKHQAGQGLKSGDSAVVNRVDICVLIIFLYNSVRLVHKSVQYSVMCDVSAMGDHVLLQKDAYM